jgi:hypothetical protein
MHGCIAFANAKTGAQIRIIGKRAAEVLRAQPVLGSGPIELRGMIWFRLRKETDHERPVLANGRADGSA